jgi:hypothetical protein
MNSVVQFIHCAPPSSRSLRKEKTKEQWLRLCEQAAVEQDLENLIELVKEINRLLKGRSTVL